MTLNLAQRMIARSVALRLVRLRGRRRAEFKIRSCGNFVSLSSTLDAKLEGDPGVYSLRFYERRNRVLGSSFGAADREVVGHAIIGGPAIQEGSGRTKRQVVSVETGNLDRSSRGWLSGWLGTEPAHFDANIRVVDIESQDGWTLPCWLQLTPSTKNESLNQFSKDWVIHVHGRGASQAETARNFALFSREGFNNLAISFRGDHIARRSNEASTLHESRSNLGLGTIEWPDLEAAVQFALSQGAQKIFIFGWSYGGAVSLQFASMSSLAKTVSAYIFDSPVISWRSTLEFQLQLARAPKKWLGLTEEFLRDPRLAKTIGLESAIDFEQFEPCALASRINRPVLILHSIDDGFIPIEPCLSLTEKNSLVELVTFQTARHCKLFNYDQQKYNESIERFIHSEAVDNR